MTTTAGLLFRTSLYAAISLATIGLWMGEDDPLPYPWLVIFCVVAAYAFTDLWGIFTIPPSLHPWLAVGVVAFFVREEMASYRIDPVMPLGHLMMLFQIILLFHAKTHRTDWLLLLTSFLQMLIAALHNNRVEFGILMGTFLALIVWTMTQFLLLREFERYTQMAVRQPGRSAWKRSVAGSFGSSLVIFAAAILLFLVIPRRGQSAWVPAPQRPGQYLSGFDERIRLGQLGTILESDEEVMTVRMFDEEGEPYDPSDEPYWRGVALTHYEGGPEGGRWERRLEIEAKSPPWARTPDRYVRQEIRLQGIHRDILFGIWPAFQGYTRSGEPLGRMMRDGTLVRPEDAPGGALQYSVESVPNGRVHLRDELDRAGRNANERLRELTQVPGALADSLRAYSEKHDFAKNRRWEDIAQAVLQHLQNPEEFDYTLHAARVNPDIDPVLDFLINRKQGHCEYFASAMALLLRANGVPARVVNGFKGGDVNDLFGPSIVVRQKHAHSWVEALGSDLVWVTLDPTPGQRRQHVVAMVKSTPTILRQVSDISRQFWSNYVLNFNSGEQEAAVYGPIRRLVVQQGRNLLRVAKQAWQAQTSGFSWIGAVAASLVMLAFILVMRSAVRLLTSGPLVLREDSRSASRGLLARLARLLRRVLSRWATAKSAAYPRIAFYDELLQHLESHGLNKQPAWTAKQFARHAETELERLATATAVAAIPQQIVERYYRVRFGHESLNQSETQEIRGMLDRLGSALERRWSVER
jgi:transglutaminase-like putative cysteine protease